MPFLLKLSMLTGLLFSTVNCSGSSSSSDNPIPATATPPVEPPPVTPPGANPPVGEIKEESGFFVEVLGEGKDQFNMHKGLETFDEPCKIALGETVDCYVDAEEHSFYARPFSLHYHAPPSMCSYVSVMPFYFVNRQTKLQTTNLNVYLDKNGDVGTADTNLDGVVDSTGLGCYSKGTTATCCVGTYTESVYIWNKEEGSYEDPTPTVVERTFAECLGGPATKSQPLTLMGLPVLTFEWVEKVGISKEYVVETPSKHVVGPAWITNFAKISEHGGRVPAAFQYDIDPGAGTVNIGHPYYTITCHDTAWETLAQTNIQFREWNTKAAYEARKTAATNHDELGVESSPFGTHPKNDYSDWLDFETAGVTVPGFEYK